MKNTEQAALVSQAFGVAIAHFQAGQMAEAEAVCRQILAVHPKSADALHMLGVLASQAGQGDDAVALIQQAIRIKKDVPAYYSNLGLALQNQNKLEEAILQYKRALALDPDMVEAHMNIGNILKTQGRFDEAVIRQKRVIALKPDYAEAHYNLGLALQSQGKFDEAAAPYEKAIALNPQLAAAYANLGVVLKELGRIDDAVMRYNQALALNPSLAETYNNLGIIFSDQRRFDEAIVQYQKAISLQPDHAEAYHNLGFALKEQGKLAESITAYQQALRFAPDNQSVLSELLHQLHHACAWEGTAEKEAALMRMVREGRTGIPPFVILNIPEAASADQLMCARMFCKSLAVPASAMFKHKPGKARDKIRIGYLSADFHQHATAYLMAELFERHDRTRFDIIGYSYGPDEDSDMRRRLVKAFDRFVDIRTSSHAAAAQKIYEDGIDILIELKGHTGSGRMRIPAYRPAPVQVNYLGYPGTLGADFIDYIIADPFILPLDQQAFYSEKIVQLPDCYQPNDTTRQIAEEVMTRAECGLPAQGFVFCSFNNSYKITPAMFDIWMRLLQAVPGSVLWLLEANSLVKENLHCEASARGVDVERLIFAPRMPLPRHLARHRLADLFLDTLPINAHTTASDALWAGLPVLTCEGSIFAGRVAGSLLSAAHLPELITASLAEYEARALHLAQHPAELLALRKKLQDTRNQVPLFDIKRFVSNIEKAYAAMWQNWQTGKLAQGFLVSKE